MFYFLFTQIMLRYVLKDKDDFFFHPIIHVVLSKLYIVFTTNKISIHKKIILFSKFFLCFVFSFVSILLFNIDDLCFHYKKNPIKSPFFIIGKFRSASTFAHRELLKSNPSFISPTFRECLFPFLCIQYLLDFFELFFDFDILLNSFFGHNILTKHQMGFNLEEEDDLLISTYFGIGWYNILQFPFFENWFLNSNVNNFSDCEKNNVYSFYQKFYQKIIYKRGNKNSILLAKSHMVDMTDFYHSFPNATIIHVERQQNKVHESTLSLFKLVHQQLHDISYDECIYHKNLNLFYQIFENAQQQLKNTIHIDFSKKVDITEIVKNKTLTKII